VRVNSAAIAVMTALHHREPSLARDLVYETDAAELSLWLAESFVRWLEDTISNGHSVPELLRRNGIRFLAEEDNAA
jgi:hypothetical protein